MKAVRRTPAPASQLLLELFHGSTTEFAAFLLRHTYFISPERIRERLVQTGSAACFPNFVRGSREYHKGKQKGDASTWNEREVKVWDNTKARDAFGRFTGFVMLGDKDGRVRGYHVAHIWERVYDPDCFTAGWNLCLMPGFLKLFTEQQDRIPLLHQVIQQAAFDLYFKSNALGMPTPQFITDPGINLDETFPGTVLNIVPQ